MGQDLVYVLHSEPAVAVKLSDGLQEAGYEVVRMTSVAEAQAILNCRQFMLPDAILTPLGDVESGDSILIALFQSNPLMEQIPLVVVASAEKDDRRKALRMGLLGVIFPPYDGEEAALTTKLAIEKHRSDQLLFGSLAQLSVPDLLQTAEVGRRSGTITIQHNGDKGTVWMRDGLVIDAEVEDKCRGEEAVYEVALWDTGTFEANFGGVEVAEVMAVLPSELLLEAMRRLDEGRAVQKSEPVVENARLAALDLSAALLNAVTSYAINYLEAPLVRERYNDVRTSLSEQHPALKAFRVTPEGPVVLTAGDGDDDTDVVDLAEAVGAWIVAFFERMEAALAWRFTPQRLARLLAPWKWEMQTLGFLGPMGIEETEEPGDDEEVHRIVDAIGKPLLVGCLVLDGDHFVELFSPYGPGAGRLNADAVVGKTLRELFAPKLAVLAEDLVARLDDETSEELSAVGEEVLPIGHEREAMRIAVVRQASRHGLVLTVNRMRNRGRSLSPVIERDPLTGSLRDGGQDRVLVANDDFLHAFEGLFARSLSHRHHALLQRFGKKWGLRHSMRLEARVQGDYKMTLREMESQMALELLSSSMGVLGLGSFEADLRYRERGLVVITHHASPFPGIFSATAGGSCSILSGFHAAIVSYLAGRHLAAREVSCSHEPGAPCVFVVATEDRLTKLLISTPGSPDHDALEEILAGAGSGENS